MRSLVDHPDAFQVRSRALLFDVFFARNAGEVVTLEGPVNHAAGDAIIIGKRGSERWPVRRDRFAQTYEAVPPSVMGRDGVFRKRPRECWALVLNTVYNVSLSGQRGILHGRPGDVLVEYAPGDQAIVEAEIFAATYDRIT